MIQPRILLIVAGAGNDALPVVAAAKSLGWQVVVADGRSTHASIARFPEADRIIVGSPGDVVPQLRIDEWTAFVLMTHNYNFDKAMLGLLLDQRTPYIGCLGPKKKLDRMLNEIHEAGTEMRDESLSKVYGPVGLDIGAETADEVAIAIVAEIKAVMNHKVGTSLKWKRAPIHDRFNGDHLIPVHREASSPKDFICAVNQKI